MIGLNATLTVFGPNEEMMWSYMGCEKFFFLVTFSLILECQTPRKEEEIQAKVTYTQQMTIDVQLKTIQIVTKTKTWID